MNQEEEGLSPELAALLADLPAEVEPAQDLWGGVEEQIAPVPIPLRPSPVSQRARWPWAAALLAASALISALVMKPVPPASAPVHTAPVIAAVQWEAEIRTTTEELQLVLEHQRGSIDPQTMEVIQQALADIDAAIADVQEALVDDPDNGALALALADVWQKKMQLLRNATMEAG